ncbi:hypothetical protein ACFU44_11125 [Nocardia rhizosphaerihabitans]
MPKVYGFDIVRRNGKTYAVAGFKVGSKKTELVTVPVVRTAGRRK